MAKVVGNLVSTIKHSTHEGAKLMLVRQVDEAGELCANQMIAVDTACSGVGDYVLLVDEGGACRMMMDNSDAAVDAVIVGVVDEFCLKFKQRR